MKTMFIEWPDFNVKVEAVLEDVRNPDLINEIWNNLPMTSIQEHAMVVSYSQITGNKLIVRYGKVTEDLMTPIVGFIDPQEVPKLDKIGEAVWNNYRLHGDERKTYIVKFSKGREA